MTAQFHDGLVYRGQEFAVITPAPEVLFDPNQHGIETIAKCTACWRGYVCKFLIENNRLFLDHLTVNLKVRAQPLFGIQPKPETNHLYDAIYDHMRHPIAYSGNVTLARGFIDALYEHGGFAPAWKFREVHVLTFEAGVLTQESDVSESAAAERDALRTTNRLPPDAPTTR
jgi:hypothetical protein